MTTVTTILIAVAALTPAAAALIARPPSPTVATRRMAVATGLASLAAASLIGITAAADGGTPDVMGLPDVVALGIDRVSAVLLFVAMATATVVLSFSARSLDDTDRTTNYAALVAVVASGAALVVVPGGPIPLVLGWLGSSRALISLCSGWSSGVAADRSLGRLRAALTVGDIALIAAVVVAVSAAGAESTIGAPDAVADLSGTSVLGIAASTIVAVLLVVAGAARSALVPFHRWLVGTLHAPTPVSALVHAGFVSGAGILLIRFAPTFLDVDVAVVAAFVVAIATVVVGVGISLTRSDVKGALAWSTVAQMAFMVMQIAVGALAAAVFHIIGHGMYKAALFLGAGDTPGAKLRERRSPAPLGPLPGPSRAVLAALVATAAIGAAWLVVPVDTTPAGDLLVIAFAWISVAAATQGWLRRSPLRPLATVASATLAAATAAIAYLGGLGLFKEYLAPSLPAAEGTVVGPEVLGATLAAVAALVGIVWLASRAEGTAARPRRTISTLADDRIAIPAVDRHRQTAVGLLEAAAAPPEPSVVRADVARAAAVVAPQWPLSSFVAVNPLGGLESLGFDEAAATSARWSGARTHLSLEQYRADHAQGRTTIEDLLHSALLRLTEVCCRHPHRTGDRVIEPLDVILADLLHGPETDPPRLARTELERRYGVDVGQQFGIDDLVGGWIASYVAPAPWPLAASDEAFMTMARREAVAFARRRLSPAAAAWLLDLDDDPAEILAAALAVCDIDPGDRVDEIRGHLSCLPGWAGLAKWRSEWATADETMPALSLPEVAAARAMVEAAIVASIAPDDTPIMAGSSTDADTASAARVDAAAEHLDLRDAEGHAWVASILDDVPASLRNAIWLEAQEHHHDSQLLDQLDRRGGHADPNDEPRPESQVVFCIDVRSEGLRRHLETLGQDQTMGFAGFFGIPMRVQELGWTHAEPRCPVLVNPAVTALERPLIGGIDDSARLLRDRRLTAGLRAAHARTKATPGGGFAAAEALGWLAGPAAAVRTLMRPKVRRSRPATATTVRLADEVPVDQRLFFAETVLRTMGLTDGFAPVVVLCGHTAHTTNNPHATSLECGACGGAGGAGNARAVASLLNAAEIRHGLAERGIEIPDDTWFLAGIHDTTADTVDLLDTDQAPGHQRGAIRALQYRLSTAGERQADARAALLPGTTGARGRGADWAQVRPEWGLAANAAFVIGPRSLTEGLDLQGRAFLHSYDPVTDPDGAVLEAIMTAPLVVGHWISSQYYFSTVDPQVLGAGDKLLHNPIGSIGVLGGPGGDLRVGLPLQSTHVGDRPHHRATRLLAVIDADPRLIDDIVRRNPILATLVEGSWLRIAGRSGPGEPWSTRTANGTWLTTADLSDIDVDIDLGADVDIDSDLEAV